MDKAKKSRLGGLHPKYNFILNPYPHERLSKCPMCDRRTGQRKLPLLIHIDPMHLIALHYTCRYCRYCDLLIGHKHEIEHLLTSMFAQYDSLVIGNDYLIVGTVEKKAWRAGMKQPKAVVDMLPHVHDFETYYRELRLTQPGWYRDDQQPPVVAPPLPTEWVKTEYGRKAGRKHR